MREGTRLGGYPTQVERQNFGGDNYLSGRTCKTAQKRCNDLGPECTISVARPDLVHFPTLVMCPGTRTSRLIAVQQGTYASGQQRGKRATGHLSAATVLQKGVRLQGKSFVPLVSVTYHGAPVHIYQSMCAFQSRVIFLYHNHTHSFGFKVYKR